MIVSPTFTQAPNVKPLINIGCLFDIPTGTYMEGKHGESILNGGLAYLTAIVGQGNYFKSTIKNYMLLSAFDKVRSQTQESSISSYDTEINVHEESLKRFMAQFEHLDPDSIFVDRVWLITDANMLTGDEFFKELKNFCDAKMQHKKELMCELPFLERDGQNNMQALIPTFGDIDSLSEFTTSDVLEMGDKFDLGDSGANTMHMRSGLSKMRMLMDLPVLTAKFNHYMLLTAQVGKEIPMGAGPMAVPQKKLQFLKNNDKIKGISDKALFLIHNMWQVISCTLLLNKGTNEPEYPSGNSYNKDPDLNLVTMKLVRSKSGTSGVEITILVSQQDGVLSHLSQFHYIKTNGRFGLGGNDRNYFLELLPDVNLSRTTVRDKIDNNPALRRALEITSELCQINQYWRNIDHNLICTPKELYEGIKSQGYDWDKLLATRGYWVINEESHQVPFLSTMDLLKMRVGKYKPWWYK